MRSRQTFFALAILACSTHALADNTSPNPNTVVVRHDSPSKRAGGIVLTSIGGLFFTGGAALTVGTGIGIAGGRGDVLSIFDLALGGAAMVIGLAMGIPGIVLVATSGEKVVHHVDEAKLAPPPMPRSVTLPILSATFLNDGTVRVKFTEGGDVVHHCTVFVSL